MEANWRREVPEGVADRISGSLGPSVGFPTGVLFRCAECMKVTLCITWGGSAFSGLESLVFETVMGPSVSLNGAVMLPPWTALPSLCWSVSSSGRLLPGLVSLA